MTKTLTSRYLVKDLLDAHDKLIEECEKAVSGLHFEDPLRIAIEELTCSMEDLIANVELSAEKTTGDIC